MNLAFASYNIHKAVGLDRRRDPDRIVAVLRELDADVIALQEADRRFGERETTIPRVLLDDTKWKIVPVARRRRSIGWHGNALLVRRDIEVIEAQPLDLPTLEPRGAICADLAIGGQRLRALGMHLDLSGLQRGDDTCCFAPLRSLRRSAYGDDGRFQPMGPQPGGDGPLRRELAGAGYWRELPQPPADRNARSHRAFIALAMRRDPRPPQRAGSTGIRPPAGAGHLAQICLKIVQVHKIRAAYVARITERFP